VSGPGTIFKDVAGDGGYRAPGNLLAAQVVTIRAVSTDGKHTVERDIRVILDHKLAGPWIQLLAGHPGERGIRRAKGADARFLQLAHAASLGDGIPHRNHSSNKTHSAKWCLTDVESHQLLLLAADGSVESWLGGDGKTGGFADGRADQALFNRPASLTVWPEDTKSQSVSRIPGGDTEAWRALVADAGNHCLRLVGVSAEGTQVTTFAGQPQEPGYQDGPLAQAQFCSPRMAVFGSDGAIYVADAGNGAIRRILKGQVTTVAGAPQDRWDAQELDGKGAEARFSGPMGLVMDSRNGNLYVSGLASIRRITPDGNVTTLAGTLHNHKTSIEAGFEEWMERPAKPEGKEPMGGIPCLRFPAGLSMAGSLLFIADYGNDAIRILNVDGGRMTTFAGHSEYQGDMLTTLAEDSKPVLFRAGRPRQDGHLPAKFAKDPHAGGYATLACPRLLAFGPKGETLIVLGSQSAANASCVLEVKRDPLGKATAPAPSLPGGKEGKAETVSD
jgi:hypothetical protein